MDPQQYVVFQAPWGRYNPGDLARFPAVHIERLTERQARKESGELVPLVKIVSKRDAQEIVDRERRAKFEEQQRRDKDLHAVRFKFTAGPYNEGDVASFPRHVAARYVDGYVAQGGRRIPSVAEWHRAGVKDEAEEVSDEIEASGADEAAEEAQKPKPRSRRSRRGRKAKGSG